MLSNLSQDYRRYVETGHTKADMLFSRGFQAVLSFRFRSWLLSKHIPWIHVIIGYLTEVITNVEIPTQISIGKGLVIFHGGPIVINGYARLGENISLRPGVVIGSNDIGENSPQIGDNVDIGVGAKIIGDICIGDHSKIGANAVVVKSFPPNSVLVGIPARNISKDIK